MYTLLVPASSSVLRHSLLANSSKRIWVVNPFDELPNATDVPLRYWALCRTLAEQGHEVIWWSSDFSHRTKTQREPCPPTDGFSIRLIASTPYAKNISLARLKNHKQFAQGFFRDAIDGLKSGALNAPDRIVVSLPPLGVAEQAFKIRDFVNQIEGPAGASRTAPNIQKGRGGCPPLPPSISHSPSAISHHDCQVVVDIMDAWPEAFYQVLPKPLRTLLGPILLAPMHRSAQRAYQGADKISAVGQSYLDLAQKYLDHQSSVIHHQSSKTLKPMFLCYHGTDLARFKRKRSRVASAPDSGTPHAAPNKQQTTNNKQPLKAVYLGSMGSGYDLETIIEVAARWKAEDIFPFQIHFAGDGPQREALEARCEKLGLTTWKRHSCRLSIPSEATRPAASRTGSNEKSDKSVASTSAISPQSSVINHQSSKQPATLNSLLCPWVQPPTASSARIVFHGHLGKTPITVLLESSDLALVPNRPGSLVACPYKAGEYAAAGLPMVSCLGGELGELLRTWNAGSAYNEGDVDSLDTAFKNVSENLDLLKHQSRNARTMAEDLFDRNRTYPVLAEFILETDE
jgi:glycosyltransferase involved in cell wall biosynthesis